jgi:uncharacterized NAD-dependent epimerase/dehydratase family protein
MNNALLLTNGLLHKSDAKTAHGLIRGTDRFHIVGVVDGPDNAGKDAGVVLDGKHRDIPVFASLDEALSILHDVQWLVIGVATVGGRLPGNMLEVVIEAIRSGLSIVNGLHEFLTDKEEIVALAKQKDVVLIDVRKPRSKSELKFWTGEIFNVTAPVVAVLGMDCAMGKRTMARMLMQSCRSNKINAEMIYTGQTGWMQGGDHGFIFDSTLNDFVSGELEQAIVQCWKNKRPDIIFLEGQSALRNPSGPCGIELMISGNAKHAILMFAPKRKYFDDLPHWGEIPSVESEIDIIGRLGTKVIAAGMNTEGCTDEEAFRLQDEYQIKLGIPVLLPMQQGVDMMIPLIHSLISES